MTIQELNNTISKKEVELIIKHLTKFISNNEVEIIKKYGIIISKSNTNLEENIIKHHINLIFNGGNPTIKEITFEFLNLSITVPYDTLQYIIRQNKLNILLK